MSAERSFRAEYLRPLEYVTKPDPRSVSFVRWDTEKQEFVPRALADHHAAMSTLNLHAGVPEDVTIQFETAKNLFVYAWFVYRFHAVSEHQSLTCLEFGLRERFGKDMAASRKLRRTLTLKPLLRHAVDRGHVRNEGFKRWHDKALLRAQSRFEYEKGEEMRRKGLTSIEYDYSDVVVTDQDRDWNLIEVLVESLPFTRNEYAHGSASIHNQVRGTLELTMEILNQVFLPSPHP